MKTVTKKKIINSFLNLYTLIGITLWVLAAVLIFTPIIPQVWYAFNPQATTNEFNSLTQSVDSDYNSYTEQPIVNKPTTTLPTLDRSLTTTNTLKISKIGINAPIQEGSDSKVALQKGPWLVNNFGKPSKNESPIIIASHRWGGVGWNKNQRDTMSFYKLPNLEVGDTVEIIWGQRLYKYKIYKSREDSKITDYDADLILYTCKMYWESPVRIFKYAKRVD